MGAFHKIATLKVKNGTYKKDGEEKSLYHEVGVLLSSPHGSQMIMKMHATASSEPKLVSVYFDEGVKVRLEKTEKEGTKDVVPKDDEIPF